MKDERGTTENRTSQTRQECWENRQPDETTEKRECTARGNGLVTSSFVRGVMM